MLINKPHVLSDLEKKYHKAVFDWDCEIVNSIDAEHGWQGIDSDNTLLLPKLKSGCIDLVLFFEGGEKVAALSYHQQRNINPKYYQAPIVIAYGTGNRASLIMDYAEKNGVYTHENRPLTRMLFWNASVGLQIRHELFQALADVYSSARQEGYNPSPDFSFEQKLYLAEKGDVREQYSVALRYLRGEDVEVDEHEAYKWLCKAAAGGFVNAQSRLGVMLIDNEHNGKYDREAFVLLLKAASKWDYNACLYLGYCYYYGIGTELKDRLALYWFKQAAAQWVPEAFLAVGMCYENGVGTEVDLHRAMNWYNRAAELGYVKSDEIDISYIRCTRKWRYLFMEWDNLRDSIHSLAPMNGRSYSVLAV